MTPREIQPTDFPHPAQFHRVAAGEIAYVDLGPTAADATDEVILCVHGNPTWSYYYRRVIDRFGDRRRVIAVDHLGCGRSDRPSQSQFDYTMAAHRDNLLSLIESLDLRRVTLLAHDWGGAIGTAAAVAASDRFDRLALLNTAAFPPPYIPLRISACRWPIVGPVGVRGLNAFARAATTMTMNRRSLTSSQRDAYLAPYNSWKNRVAVDAFVRDIPMKPSHRTYQTLVDLERSLPSLASKKIALIWGMKDWCFRPECLRRLQAVWPDATVTEIEDAGHYVLEDAHEETLAAISQLLAR